MGIVSSTQNAMSTREEQEIFDPVIFQSSFAKTTTSSPLTTAQPQQQQQQQHHHTQVKHIEFDVVHNKVSMSLSASQGAAFYKHLIDDLNGTKGEQHSIPQVFSVLEYPLSDFEVVILCISSFLDCRELCHFTM
jgi:hypothetical protein